MYVMAHKGYVKMTSRVMATWFCCMLLAICISSCSKRDDRASALNNKAWSYARIDLDSTEHFAQMAYDMSKRNSAERAFSVNILARVAFSRLEFVKAWELYNSVPQITANLMERLTAKLGLMRICQRISDNVSYYEYRNEILLLLRTLHEESAILDEDQYQRIISLERTFRMESARYWFELEQPAQAEYEMSYVKHDNDLIEDTDRYLMYMYMYGLGVGFGSDGVEDGVEDRLRVLDECLRSSIRDKDIRMQAMSMSAIAGILLEYGPENVLSGISGDMLSRLNASDVSADLLPIQLTLKSIQLFAQYGSIYDIIDCKRLLAACYLERGLYEDALNTLAGTLEMLNSNCRINYPENESLDRLELFREDGLFVEEQWMQEAPLAALPEMMSAIREQISLAYSGLDDKPASDYNRTIYLELQKNIRLDRKFEARTGLLERSNNRLTVLLFAIVGIILLFLLFLALFHRRIDAYRKRHVALMQKAVRLCEDILHPLPEGSDITDELNRRVSPSIREITGASEIRIDPEGHINVDWGAKRPDRRSLTLLNTIELFLAIALRNAEEMRYQADRLRQAEKRHYVYRMHADRNKRENIARKTCCQVVAESLPYIDRMRAEIGILTRLPSDSAQYENSLQYIRELAGYINRYNDILSGWIRMRQGMVRLNVESFGLQKLFDIVKHGSRSFSLKGITLEVVDTDAIVRADRVLTLFMLNTLADNARKFTPSGGHVRIEAVEDKEWVEISVRDNGIGLSAEDVKLINENRVYNSESIGSDDAVQHKGSGFGLMNCRGIIDKYRKSDDIFSVCRFHVESVQGKGSRFSFRLPKGVKRALTILALLFAVGPAGAQNAQNGELKYNPDSLIVKAYNYAYMTYLCNTENRYSEALVYADSAFTALNDDYLANGGDKEQMLYIINGGTPPETRWLESGFATDYETILWLRNEVAVSALALRDWPVYRYNDNAYLKLFKLFYSESRIEEDCLELQRYNSNLSMALIILVVILLFVILARFMMYSRHWLRYRSDLQQVLRVINRISEVTSVRDIEAVSLDDILQRLVDGIYVEMEHLYDIRQLIISVIDENKTYSVSSHEKSVDERLPDRVRESLESGRPQSTSDRLCQAVPLVVEIDSNEHLVGAIGLSLKHKPDETWQVITDMVTHYLATALYSCVMRFQSGLRSLEQIQEDSDRIRFEDNRLHVSNLVLDNCLSTLKHETVWYPNRIMQMANDEANAREMQELVDYYREIYGILSQYALAQTKERLVHLEKIDVDALFRRLLSWYGKNRNGKDTHRLEISQNGLFMSGDRAMIEYLIENLLESSQEGGPMRLDAIRDGRFVRISLSRISDAEPERNCDTLFSTLENRDNMAYVICRQIIREHDEVFGHTGCRINAECKSDGTVIWFTLPAWE